MGKHGPCCHCGVPSTPLWRNGPPDKPILCNACGSRWRTKGSLTNYTPLHARAEPDNFLNHKASRIKIVTSRDKESNFLKRKRTYENAVIGNIASNYSDNFWNVIDDDTSNRSSSGSAVSNSGGYAPFDTTYGNELTGYSQSFAIDVNRTNPANKRASIPRPKLSSIATLTKDLCTILHQQQSSGSYGLEEDVLLFESGESIFSAETGHGSYLIKDTSSVVRDEDSETNSISVDDKPYLASETCSFSKTLGVYTSSKAVDFQNADMKIGRASNSSGILHEKTERNKIQSEISESYGSQSLLSTGIIDQKDVLISNHEEILRHLTNNDDSRQPNSLQSLSDSTDFVDSFSTFSEGRLNAAPSEEVKSDDYNKLKRLVLCNLTKSKLEHYNVAKKSNQETEASTEILKKIHIRVGKGKTKLDNDENNSTGSSPRNLISLGG